MNELEFSPFRLSLLSSPHQFPQREKGSTEPFLPGGNAHSPPSVFLFDPSTPFTSLLLLLLFSTFCRETKLQPGEEKRRSLCLYPDGAFQDTSRQQ
ncbi:MAG: hypothetical protein M3Y76_07800 [Chloroflexota bacterium]|nr:hypothetical protein [Chloroflexota bacterium]